MDASLLAFDHLGVALPGDKETVFVAADVMFVAQKLHNRSRFCWAVVGSPSGAIATASIGGALLMRLREDEAERLAATMTEAATRAATAH